LAAVLNTNSASLYAAKSLQNAQSKMASSVERLSSGLRINRAKDDAAGLGISNTLTTQINNANQGIKNLNDGISLVQTAEGAIGAAMEMAQRIVTLATQGANGTMGSSERTSLKSEMQQLLTAIESIGGRTKFSGVSLLDSDARTTATGKFILQATNNSTDIVSLDAAAFKNIGGGYGAVGATSIAVANGSTTFSLATGGVYSSANVGTEVYLRTITGTNSTYTRVGTVSGISSNVITVNSTATAVSAGATLVFSGQLTQVLTNDGTTADFSLVESVDKLANTTASFQMVARVSAEYVKSLATQRSTLGAYQNQIEYTVNNVQELSSNLTAARSNVQDTDYATETANLTKNQILQQAATAMLAQANQMPNVILSLLK
jgi:flagellin